jgi:hypothetical protein
MDTTGTETLGRFWAGTLGWSFHPDDEAGTVRGAGQGHELALLRVPEPKTVKHRVHLDVHCADVAEVVALGATVELAAEESGLPWTVLRDPEGGELCAFVRESVPDNRLFQVVVDAVDAEASARWWAEVLGGRATSEDDPEWWRTVDVPGLPFDRITFQRVPEPKTMKNRIHWDVHGDTAALLDAGATLLRGRDAEISWDVLADPEGNEFCVFADPPG